MSNSNKDNEKLFEAIALVLEKTHDNDSIRKCIMDAGMMDRIKDIKIWQLPQPILAAVLDRISSLAVPDPDFAYSVTLLPRSNSINGC